jgi:hypothetical protein
MTTDTEIASPDPHCGLACASRGSARAGCVTRTTARGRCSHAIRAASISPAV